MNKKTSLSHFLINHLRQPSNLKFGLVILSLSLLILYTAMIHNNKPERFKIGIIADANQSELKAFRLYEKRFNKYGGIDNTEMELVVIDSHRDIKDDFISVLNIKTNPHIVIDRETKLHLTREIETSHMNYRMSATQNDCTRKMSKIIDKSALSKLKGLDIIIESLPERLMKPQYLKDYLIATIPTHHYFENNITEKTRVKVGIAMNEILDIDMEELTYKMDFYLWFRWKGEHNISVDDIEFINTIKPSFLAETNSSVSSIVSATLIEDIDNNNTNYKKYHIVANFKAIEHKNYALGEQNLPIRFRHKNLSLKDIHYVKDETDHSRGIFSQNRTTSRAEWEKLRFDVINHPSLFLNYTLPYSNYRNRVSLGDPMDIDSSLMMSEFTMRFAIKYVAFSVRGIEGYINGLLPLGEGRIHIPSMIIYLLISIIINLHLTRIRKRRILRKGWSHVAWLINLLVIFAMLLGAEFLSSQLVFNLKMSIWGVENMDIIESIMTGLKLSISILWWLIPAYYITSAFEQFVWCPIEERTRTEIPHVLRLFINIIVYALATVGILAYVLDVTTNSLMATSGAFAVLFAIASKVDISNIVAGLGISFAKVFKLGDWVKIDGIEGQVVEMTPRSTKVLTFDNSIINIPNTKVGGAVIENCTEDAFRLMIHLEVVPMDYEFVEEKLLEAVDKTSGVLKSPKSFVAFLGQGDSAQIFEVYFFIDDYSMKAYYVQAVWRDIWSVCEEFGIEMSTPQREHFIKNLE